MYTKRYWYVKDQENRRWPCMIQQSMYGSKNYLHSSHNDSNGRTGQFTTTVTADELLVAGNNTPQPTNRVSDPNQITLENTTFVLSAFHSSVQQTAKKERLPSLESNQEIIVSSRSRDITLRY